MTLIFLAMPLAAAFAQDVIGKWKLKDGSAIVEVYKNGKAYNCSMKVDGDVLKVRGSLDQKGLLGRTMDWFRVK